MNDLAFAPRSVLSKAGLLRFVEKVSPLGDKEDDWSDEDEGTDGKGLSSQPQPQSAPASEEGLPPRIFRPFPAR